MATPPTIYRHNLNVALININGLREKMNYIQTKIARHKTDVLAVTETKLDDSVEDLRVELKEFDLWREDRNKNGGGVAVYIKGFTGTKREDLMNNDIEIIWVEMELPDGQPLLVGCCYRPPSSKADYLQRICDNIKTVSRERKPVMLMGDFNINWFEDSPQKTRIQSVLDMCNLTQIVDDTTIRTSKCIDHIYTNLPYTHLECRHSLPSDHKLIMVNMRLCKVCFNTGESFNEEKFVREITKAPWTEVTKEYIPKNALCKFKDIFLSIADKHNPWKIETGRSGEEQSRDRQRTFFLQELKEAENNPPEMLKVLKRILKKRLPSRLNHINLNHFKAQSLDSVFNALEGQRNITKAKSFRFSIVTRETVERLLVSLNLPVTNEREEMELKLLRLAAMHISDPMCYILNRCINSEECEREKKVELILYAQSRRLDMVELAFSFIFDVVLFVQTKEYFTANEQPSGSLERLHELHRTWLRNGLDTYTIHTVFVEFSFSNNVLLNKLRSKGFSRQALSLIKTHLSFPHTSLSPLSFLTRFLFTLFSNEFSSVFTQSSATACENHMFIFNADQNCENLEREISTLCDQAKSCKAILYKTRPTSISSLEISEILDFLLLRHPDHLNWIKVFKTIIQNHTRFQRESEEILSNLKTYFGIGSLGVTAESLMNVLVLAHMEYKKPETRHRC